METVAGRCQRIRCQAHAFEGKIFVIASCSLIDNASLHLIGPPGSEGKLHGRRYALSGIYGPDGLAISELIDEEGIVYANIDLDDLIRPKLMHDITGNYNQFGVPSLKLNRSPQRRSWRVIRLTAPGDNPLQAGPTN